MRSWRRSSSFPASCSAATPGRRSSSICRTRIDARALDHSEHDLDRAPRRDRRRGGGGRALRLLAGRAAGAARRPARAEPIPRRDHDRGVGGHRGAGGAQLARGGGRAAGRVDGDHADRGDRRRCGSASRCSPTSRTRWWSAQRPGRLSHDPRSLALLLRTAGQGVLAPVWHEPRASRAAAAGRGGRARRALRARRRADGRRWLPRAGRHWWSTPATRPTSSSRRRWRR